MQRLEHCRTFSKIIHNKRTGCNHGFSCGCFHEKLHDPCNLNEDPLHRTKVVQNRNNRTDIYYD